MTEHDPQPGTRRRRRRTHPAGAPEPRTAPPPARTRREGGLRDIAGAGPSKLGVGGAMRARDVHRPSEDDLAEAEREIVIVRRHWTPDRSG